MYPSKMAMSLSTVCVSPGLSLWLFFFFFPNTSHPSSFLISYDYGGVRQRWRRIGKVCQKRSGSKLLNTTSTGWEKDAHPFAVLVRRVVSILPARGRPGFDSPTRRQHTLWSSPVAQLVKSPLAMRQTWVWSLGWEDPLEKGKANHSSVLAWRTPWTE